MHRHQCRIALFSTIDHVVANGQACVKQLADESEMNAHAIDENEFRSSQSPHLPFKLKDDI